MHSGANPTSNPLTGGFTKAVHHYNQHSVQGPIGTAQTVPKTPNDIYGFAQKAILHSIFEKGSSGTGVIGTS
jgi:hypothetical protein